MNLSSTVTLGLSATETNFQFYKDWLLSADVDVKLVILSSHDQDIQSLSACDGLVLSGGVDIHPRFYKSTTTDFPMVQHFNEARDEWEMKLYTTARLMSLPILAICRGMQLINCAEGGTLIQDLESEGYNNHRRMHGHDGIHPVEIVPGSLLYDLTQCTSSIINSAHHQALGLIANEFVPCAYAPDGTVEAIEYSDKTDKPFLIGVQWHPERMYIGEGDQNCSSNILKAFIKESIKHSSFFIKPSIL